MIISPTIFTTLIYALSLSGSFVEAAHGTSRSRKSLHRKVGGIVGGGLERKDFLGNGFSKDFSEAFDGKYFMLTAYCQVTSLVQTIPSSL
jgi:hypothetical protein